MEWLCGLTFALVALAACGHALWWAGASIIRAIFGTASVAGTQSPRPFRDCPACGEGTNSRASRCYSCGLDLDSKTAWKLSRVRTAQREIRQLLNSGDLDTDTAKKVLAKLQRRARILQGLPPDPVRAKAAEVESKVETPSTAILLEEPVHAPTPIREPEVVPRPEPVPAAAADSSSPIEPSEVEIPAIPSEPTHARPPFEPPSRGSVIAAFMEERNILWGELVGGLLIVGCSIALVVTLWNSLESIPYFPFLLSATITLALYGAGQYTLHHWKLSSTSRGLLVISLLLTPLNLLLLDAISHGDVALPIDVGVKLLAVGLFAWVVRGGGRDILTACPQWRWLLSLAVVGAPAMQLLPASLMPDQRFDLPAWLALGCFAAGVVIVLRDRSGLVEGATEPETLEPAAGTALLTFVGLSTFALGAAWGLHIAKPSNIAQSLDIARRVAGVALPVALAGVLIVEAGLLVQKRSRDGGLRALGTSVALLGFLAITGGLTAGWPDPLLVMLVCVAVGLFLTRIAFRESLAWAHAAAIPALALAVVVGYHGLAGHWSLSGTREALATLFFPTSYLPDAESGVVLVAFALSLAALSELLASRRSSPHVVSYALGGAACGLVGLFLVNVNGVEFPLRAALACGACAAGLLATNHRWQLRVSTHGGLWLLLIGSLWLMHGLFTDRFALWGFLLALEALMYAGLSLVLKPFPTSSLSLVRKASRDVSLAMMVLVCVFVVLTTKRPESDWYTGTLFTLALTGLAHTRLLRSPIPTYVASGFALLGMLHLNTLALAWHPTLRAVLVAFLSHATLVIAVALLFRHRVRLLALPLWRSSLVPAGCAVVLLFFAPHGRALEWSGYAVWLGMLSLAYALVWRQVAAFSAFQIALSIAAVYGGIAWIGTQDWLVGKSVPFLNAGVLANQVNCVALGLLGLAWAIARDLCRRHSLLRSLWIDRVWSVERLIIAVVVLLQFAFAIAAILPAVIEELIPPGAHLAPVVPHDEPGLSGRFAWVALGVLTITVSVSWRLMNTHGRLSATSPVRDESIATPHLIGLFILFLTLPLVWAGTHVIEQAAAIALRWGLGFAFAVGSAALAARIPLRELLQKAGFRFYPTPSLHRTFLILLAIVAGVVVAMSVQVAQLGLSGFRVIGPLPDTPFAKMGPMICNLVPLVLVVLGLADTALRERSAGYAFAGGVIFTATVAAGYALGVVTAGGHIDASQQIRIWLILTAAAAAWGIAWLAVGTRLPGGLLLAVQTRLGFAGLIFLSISVVLSLLEPPGIRLDASWNEFGRYGWLTLALTAGTAVWQSFRTKSGLKFHALAVTAAIGGVIAACAVQPWDKEGTWLSFHVLADTWAAVGLGLYLIARRTKESSWWLDGTAAALTILALRGGWSDPVRPWFPAILAIISAAIAGVAGIVGRSNVRVYVSFALASLVATLLWLPTKSNTFTSFLLMNSAGLAVAGSIWSLISMRVTEARWHIATDIARGLALVFLGYGLLPTVSGTQVDPHWLNWGATGIAVLAMGVALWDAKALIARGGLFAVGIAALLLGVSEATAKSEWIIWQTPVALAGYAMVVAGLAVAVSRTKEGFLRLPVRGDSWDWLLAAQGVVAAIALVLGVKTGLVAPTLAERLSSPGAMVLLFGASTLLLWAMPSWTNVLRLATVSLMVLVFATTAWAWPDPSGVAPWLERNAWLFVALAASGIFISEAGMMRPFAIDWRIAYRSVGGIAVGASLVVLVVNLLQQVPLYDKAERRTPLNFDEVLAMMAAVLGLIVLLIRFAINPERDPLRMMERGRTAYVYLAELLVVLFFVHVRFNLPELFRGTMVRYWTFTVMVLAFVGIGLAEFFERRRMNVLASPLRRTGVLLPLIPLLAFWAKPPAALTAFASGQAPGLSPFLAYLEKLPQHFDNYAWLWTLAGVLYGLVALSRKSFGWALLAALATNAALWAMLTHQGIPFFLHPQAWVIPLALILLVSEHVNRHRLRKELSNGLRYLGISMIYIASSADMFIAGVGNSFWLPVVLAVLCVAGVLLGILLRIRAFVYLGVGFLLLDIFAMIWHAAVNLEQTWVWYASGIVLGVAILTLFAIFEKRKRHAEG